MPPGRDIVTGLKRSLQRQRHRRDLHAAWASSTTPPNSPRSRTASPDSVFFFQQSGNASINFVKQYAEAGLKGKVPLYGVSTVLDEQTLPGMGDAAVGAQIGGFLGRQSRQPGQQGVRRAFRGDSITAGRRCSPIFAYDGARLIDSARSARSTAMSSAPTNSAPRSRPRNSTPCAASSASTPTSSRSRTSICSR